jgi:hypothetical protein
MVKEVVKTSLFKILFPKPVSDKDLAVGREEDIRRIVGSFGFKKYVTEEEIKRRRQRVNDFLNKF